MLKKEQMRIIILNKGFAERKELLEASVVVNTEIPLNRYSFFEALEDELPPSTRLELNI